MRRICNLLNARRFRIWSELLSTFWVTLRLSLTRDIAPNFGRASWMVCSPRQWRRCNSHQAHWKALVICRQNLGVVRRSEEVAQGLLRRNAVPLHPLLRMRAQDHKEASAQKSCNRRHQAMLRHCQHKLKYFHLFQKNRTLQVQLRRRRSLSIRMIRAIKCIRCRLAHKFRSSNSKCMVYKAGQTGRMHCRWTLGRFSKPYLYSTTIFSRLCKLCQIRQSGRIWTCPVGSHDLHSSSDWLTCCNLGFNWMGVLQAPEADTIMQDPSANYIQNQPLASGNQY